MSHKSYNELWRITQQKLQEQLAIEEGLDKHVHRQAVFDEVATLYLHYLVILRQLDECYDQIVHPQKRILLRKLLDQTIGRILELKQELVRLDIREIQYFDHLLAELGMQPEDASITIPKYFLRETKDSAENRKQQFREIYKTLGYIDEMEEKKPVPLTIGEAILLIQTVERGRQGRCRAALMRNIRKSQTQPAQKPRSTLDLVLAATRIQRVYRGHRARRYVQHIRKQEMIFLGMIPPDPIPKELRPQTKAEENSALRCQKQEEYRADYELALARIREEVADSETEEMSLRIQQEIKNWFMETKSVSVVYEDYLNVSLCASESEDVKSLEKEGKFPDLPSEEDGGSAAIFNPALLPPAHKGEEKPEKTGKKGKGSPGTLSQGKGTPASSSGKGKTGTKTATSGGSSKREKKAVEEQVERMEPSKFTQEIEESCREYEVVWQDRNESWNRQQRHDEGLIREEKRMEVEREVRIRVDNIMREELEKLRQTLEKDMAKKKKKKERKKRKKKDKRKKKKMKDLTPDRTTESLYEELVANGIIKLPPEVNLNDFVGSYNMLGRHLIQKGVEVSPGMLDVKRTVAEYCVLPLGSQSVHEVAPLVKSVLITGPKGSGKKMLVNAICSELGATLFDLTAANIAGKYPGKSGLLMLIHLVNKVSRLLQPSIIWIDDADKTFIKKVPKGDKTEPRRLRKELPKLIKGIGYEDRVILLGTSSCPWNFEPKSLASTYQNIILIPTPSYACRYEMWLKWLSEALNEVVPILSPSHLARISDGYTAGAIRETINEASSKFLEEEEAFQNWYFTKTAVGKKWSKRQEEMEEKLAGKKPQIKKGKKKKKKGKKGKGRKKRK
ncbi:unnamed protein product [Cyprideis torosa]|uniref:Uncharacterized protein n=1 Tax=Cyprideis torosa TaxID=163714 RepID=A0A7R8ZMR9_9CRUS|nr:unnamed protein product [Cyprideis torosa]CAG0886207.1 unnamed protein product [Cyprideis torosa]